MGETLRIEIERGFKENSYNIREGDISGSINMGNVSIEEVLDYIKEKMVELGARR